MRRRWLGAALVLALLTVLGVASAQGRGEGRGNPPPPVPGVTVVLEAAPGDSVRVVATWPAVLDGRGKPVRDYTIRIEGPAGAGLLVTATTHTADTARVQLAAGDSLRVGVAANDTRGVQGDFGWSRWVVRTWGPPPAPVVTIDTLALLPLDSVTLVATLPPAPGDSARYFRRVASTAPDTTYALLGFRVADTVRVCAVVWRGGLRDAPHTPVAWHITIGDPTLALEALPDPGADPDCIGVAARFRATGMIGSPGRRLVEALRLPTERRSAGD